VIGIELIGGLVGCNNGTVTESYVASSVTGEKHVGGPVGRNDEGRTMSNCYATGGVTGDDIVGDLVGLNGWGSNVSNSYSAGTVTGYWSVGGLVGRNQDSSNVSNSFWDTETRGQTTSAGGTGKTTADMKSIDTFSGARWSIVAVANHDIRNPSYIWNIADGETYPFLSWQSVS